MAASLSSTGSSNRRRKKKRGSQVLGLRYLLWLSVLFCLFCYRFMQSLQMFEDEMKSLQHLSFYDAAWNRDEFDVPIEEIALAYAHKKPESESAFTQANAEGTASEGIAATAEEMTTQGVSQKLTKSATKRPVPDMTGMDGGVVFYLHVPKTGGTTIRTNFGGWKHGFNEDSVQLGLDYVTGNWREYFTQVVPTVDKYLASKNEGDKRRNTIFIEVHGMDSYTVLELEPILTKWRYLSEKSGVPFFSFTILREALSAQVSFFNEYRIRGDIRFDPLRKKMRRKWEPEEKVAVQKRMVTLAYQDPQCLFMSRGELTFGDYWGKVKVPNKEKEERDEQRLLQFMEFLRLRPKDKQLKMTRKEFIKMERKVRNRKINDKVHRQIIAHLHKHIFGTAEEVDAKEEDDEPETAPLTPTDDDDDKKEEGDTENNQQDVNGDSDEETNGDNNEEANGDSNDDMDGDNNDDDDQVEEGAQRKVDGTDKEDEKNHDVTSLLEERESNQEIKDGEAERRRLSEEQLLKENSIASLANGNNPDRAKRIQAFKEKYARKRRDQEAEGEQRTGMRGNRQNLKALAQERKKEKARLAKMRENLTREECRKVYTALETTFDWIGVTDKLNSETFPLITKILFGKSIPLHHQRGSDKMLNQLRLEEVTAEVLDLLKEKSGSDQELYESASRDYTLDMWEGFDEVETEEKTSAA